LAGYMGYGDIEMSEKQLIEGKDKNKQSGDK
jgi:hypothetical protein